MSFWRYKIRKIWKFRQFRVELRCNGALTRRLLHYRRGVLIVIYFTGRFIKSYDALSYCGPGISNPVLPYMTEVLRHLSPSIVPDTDSTSRPENLPLKGKPPNLVLNLRLGRPLHTDNQRKY